MTRRGGAAFSRRSSRSPACVRRQEEPPAKVDAEAEQAEALERARHDAFGTQVQALDKAKALRGRRQQEGVGAASTRPTKTSK